MKILFLTNLMPYPLDNGGKIKTYSTLTILHEAGHSIDLVCFTENKDKKEQIPSEIKKICNDVVQIYLKLTTAENIKYMLAMALKSLCSKYSFGVYKYISSDMRDALRDLSKKNPNGYDYVYYDHLQLGVYKDYVDKNIPHTKAILDEHNCETLIVERNADMTRSFLKRVFLKIEAYKLKRFEKEMLLCMDTCIVLSHADYNSLKHLCGREFTHSIIPIAVPDNRFARNEIITDGINILFLGTLTWEPNNQGIIWFMKNVVPLLEEKKINYTLYIVGKNPSYEVRQIAENNGNVIVTGYVESVEEYYNKCHCMVVPLFFGSGQRVKIIEAFSRGMPVVSTTIGAEGLTCRDKVNIDIADDEKMFCESIFRMFDDEVRERLSRNGRLLYDNEYSVAAIKKKMLEILN